MRRELFHCDKYLDAVPIRLMGFRKTCLGVTKRLRMDSATLLLTDLALVEGGGGGGGILPFLDGLLFLLTLFLLGECLLLMLADEFGFLDRVVTLVSSDWLAPFSLRNVGCFDNESRLILSCGSLGMGAAWASSSDLEVVMEDVATAAAVASSFWLAGSSWWSCNERADCCSQSCVTEPACSSSTGFSFGGDKFG